MRILASVALADTLSWASGLRLYAALLVAGMPARIHLVALPPKLEILAHAPVLVTTGILLAVNS